MSDTNNVSGSEDAPLLASAATESSESPVSEPISEVIAPAPSAGQLLREARAASGMHIGTLSLALKVPVKKLEALEADDWAQLPDAVFVRALATSVCRQIKTDSAPILAALPQSKSFQGIDEGSKIAIEPSFHSPSDSIWRKLNLRLSLPMILGALVLLLAAALLVFLPDFAKQQSSKKTEIIEKIEPIVIPESVAPEAATMASAPITAPAATLVQAPVIVASSPVAVLPTPAAPVAVAPPVNKVIASTPAVTTTPPAKPVISVPVAAPLSAGASILRLVAKGEVWVEVKDSKGAILVQRTMQPKEVINATGSPPLSVVVGRINEMQSVEVRGKPFSLSGLSPDNVARFEVK